VGIAARKKGRWADQVGSSPDLIVWSNVAADHIVWGNLATALGVSSTSVTRGIAIR
jgi:hypothetical protein